MPLSISSSRKPAAADIVVLLVVCVSFGALLELGTRFSFDRMSQMEHRRQMEFKDALAMRSFKDRHGVSVLVVGNSLLLEGVNFPQLQQEVGPEIELRRTVVENTSYLDWYYGLRRLFRMGANPDVVVVMLNPIQLTSASFNGDYTAHLLVDRGDLLAFSRDIAADRNAISSLALANLSSFYGTRTEIRSWILGKILPGALHLFRPAPMTSNTEDPGNVAPRRIAQLKALCAQHGAELVVVLPPARLKIGAEAILQAGAANEVKILSPIAPGVLPSSDYSDNFHLNAHGAGKFTPALAAGLRQILWQFAVGQTRMSVSPATVNIHRQEPAMRRTASAPI